MVSVIATMPGTERLAMRRTDWPDVDHIIALYANTEVTRHLGDGRPMGPAQVLSFEMPRLMAYNKRSDYLGCWTARVRETGSFVGWFMISPADTPDVAELSYRLHPTAQDYDVEGVREMLDLARSADIVTVVATAAADDASSQHVLADAGLQVVGTPNGRISYQLRL